MSPNKPMADTRHPTAVMRTLRRGLILAMVCFAGYANAAGFQWHGLTIAIPPGFDGPIESRPGAYAESVGFAVPGTVGVPTNTLQMARLQLPGTPPAMSDDERFQFLSMQLTKMMKALERRRTSYSQTAFEKVKLGSLFAVRSAWTGKDQDIQMNGVFYCLLIDSGVIFLQTSGPGDKPDGQQALAISALNKLQDGT